MWWFVLLGYNQRLPLGFPCLKNLKKGEIKKDQILIMSQILWHFVTNFVSNTQIYFIKEKKYL